jgi:two-component system sensor histidine kinase YesM
VYQSISKRIVKIIVITALISIIAVSIPGMLLFSSKIKEEALSSKKRIMEEIVNQADYKIETLQREAEEILSDRDLNELLSSALAGDTSVKNQISLLINKFVNDNYETGIHSAVIRLSNGMEFTSITRIYSDSYPVDEEYLKSHTYYLGTPQIYTDQDITLKDEIRFVTPMNSQNPSDGYLILNVDLASFETIFCSASEESDRLQWLDYKNDPLYPLENAYDTESFTHILDFISKIRINSQAQFAGDNVYTLIQFSKRGGIKMVMDVSSETLLKPYQWIFIFYAISLIIVVLIIILSTIPVLLRRLHPLVRLTRHMKTTSKEASIVPFEKLHTNDEIETLADAFNTMAENINEKNKLSVQHESDRAKLKFSLLTSQINPHFVYNTLNIITHLSRRQKYDEIIKVNSALIRILKDTLRIDDKEVSDTVEHEFSIIEQYILIQKYRYGSAFTVGYHADENARKMLIPKNIIQPMVENALFHGIVPLLDDNFTGKIVVSVSYTDDQIILSVSDNGIGMDSEHLEQVKRFANSTEYERGKHIGLKSVYTRISHLFGDSPDNSRFLIQSEPGKGTRITVIMDRIN